MCPGPCEVGGDGGCPSWESGDGGGEAVVSPQLASSPFLSPPNLTGELNNRLLELPICFGHFQQYVQVGGWKQANWGRAWLCQGLQGPWTRTSALCALPAFSFHS